MNLALSGCIFTPTTAIGNLSVYFVNTSIIFSPHLGPWDLHWLHLCGVSVLAMSARHRLDKARSCICPLWSALRHSRERSWKRSISYLQQEKRSHFYRLKGSFSSWTPRCEHVLYRHLFVLCFVEIPDRIDNLQPEHYAPSQSSLGITSF